MTVYLVKCEIKCGPEATSQGYARIFKSESDVFLTEKEAQKYKDDFFKKYEKKFGCWVQGRVHKKEI